MTDKTPDVRAEVCYLNEPHYADKPCYVDVYFNGDEVDPETSIVDLTKEQAVLICSRINTPSAEEAWKGVV